MRWVGKLSFVKCEKLKFIFKTFSFLLQTKNSSRKRLWLPTCERLKRRNLSAKHVARRSNNKENSQFICDHTRKLWWSSKIAVYSHIFVFDKFSHDILFSIISNERPFQCTICNKSYKTSSMRAAHMDSHISGKTFEVTVLISAFKLTN